MRFCLLITLLCVSGCFTEEGQETPQGSTGDVHVSSDSPAGSTGEVSSTGVPNDPSGTTSGTTGGMTSGTSSTGDHSTSGSGTWEHDGIGGSGSTGNYEETCSRLCDAVDKLTAVEVAKSLNVDCAGPNGYFFAYECEEPAPNLWRVRLAQVVYKYLENTPALSCGAPEPTYYLDLEAGSWQFDFLTPLSCVPDLFPPISGYFCAQEYEVCFSDWEMMLPIIMANKGP